MKKKHTILLIILAVLLVASIFGIITFRNIQSELDKLAAMPIENVDLAGVADGVHIGKYQVFPVAVEVAVTVKNHIITDIDLVKHENGQGAPAEAVLDQVLKVQTPAVDVITGATYSSKVILKAIEDALLNG